MPAELKVIFVGSVKSKENNQAFMYYVNDGIFGSFNFLFQDHEPFKPGLLKVRVCINNDFVKGQDKANSTLLFNFN